MMSDADEEFILPETVKAYLTDRAIRTGVEALLTVKVNDLPRDLRINELGNYYAARAGAELTRLDWASTLYDLWDHIWGTVIGNDWLPATADELIDNDLSVTPQGCWADRALCVFHSKGGLHLSTGVAFESDKTQITFSLDNEDRALLHSLAPFEWHGAVEGDWEEWLVFTIDISPAESHFSLGALQAAAKLAIETVDATAASLLRSA